MEEVFEVDPPVAPEAEGLHAHHPDVPEDQQHLNVEVRKDEVATGILHIYIGVIAKNFIKVIIYLLDFKAN